jgi:hypothetical protein
MEGGRNKKEKEKKLEKSSENDNHNKIQKVNCKKLNEINQKTKHWFGARPRYENSSAKKSKREGRREVKL